MNNFDKEEGEKPWMVNEGEEQMCFIVLNFDSECFFDMGSARMDGFVERPSLSTIGAYNFKVITFHSF